MLIIWPQPNSENNLDAVNYFVYLKLVYILDPARLRYIRYPRDQKISQNIKLLLRILCCILSGSGVIIIHIVTKFGNPSY